MSKVVTFKYKTNEGLDKLARLLHTYTYSVDQDVNSNAENTRYYADGIGFAVKKDKYVFRRTKSGTIIGEER